jgi:hypothetical protein
MDTYSAAACNFTGTSRLVKGNLFLSWMMSVLLDVYWRCVAADLHLFCPSREMFHWNCINRAWEPNGFLIASNRWVIVFIFIIAEVQNYWKDLIYLNISFLKYIILLLNTFHPRVLHYGKRFAQGRIWDEGYWSNPFSNYWHLWNEMKYVFF